MTVRQLLESCKCPRCEGRIVRDRFCANYRVFCQICGFEYNFVKVWGEPIRGEVEQTCCECREQYVGIKKTHTSSKNRCPHCEHMSRLWTKLRQQIYARNVWSKKRNQYMRDYSRKGTING